MFISLSPQKIAKKKENGQNRSDEKANCGGSLNAVWRCADEDRISPGNPGKYAA